MLKKYTFLYILSSVIFLMQAAQLNAQTCAITCPADVVVDLGPGECEEYIVPSLLTASFSGSCAIAITNNSIYADDMGADASGSYPIGTTIVTFSTADFSGNVATCDVNVTINGFVPSSNSLACNGQINISLGPDCETTITADMILEGGPYGCYDNYLVVFTDTGEPAVVNMEHIGQLISISVIDPISGISCWGYVLVEDKLPPELECSSYTIGCEQDPTPGADVPPAPGGGDACGNFTIEYEDDIVDLGCADPDYVSIIYRTWTVTDSYGNEDMCDDTIFVLKRDLTDVVLPPNYDGQALDPLACNGNWDVNGNEYPDVEETGEPGGALCDNIAVVYEDTVLPLCGASYKVLRNWTIFDWCANEVLNHIQIIKVESAGPSISFPGDITIYADNTECLASSALPIPNITFECTADGPGFYEVVVEDGAIGNVTWTGQYYVVSDLPIGQHTVWYKAYDECGNPDQGGNGGVGGPNGGPAITDIVITVLDNSPPVAICEGHTVVSLTNDGIAAVPAYTFDDGSFDNCNDVYFKVRRMDTGACGGSNGDDDSVGGYQEYFDDKIHFCCEDLGGPIMVQFRVYDKDPGLGPIHPNWEESNVNHYTTCMVEVTVQDKTAPTIVCPPNVTFDCDDVIDLADLEDPYSSNYGGAPFVNDNCSADLSVQVFDNRVCGLSPTDNNGNPLPAIQRYITASDGNGSNTCIQNIFVIDSNPFSGNNINWPDDIDVGCMSGIEPEDLPSYAAYPDYTESGCGQIAVSYEDQAFYYVDGVCAKILRTWTVLDWCQFDQSNPNAGGIWEYTQVIKVVNTTAPTFTECSNVNVISTGDCQSTVELSAIAEDDCDGDNLEYTWVIDANSDGSPDFFGNGNSVTDTYPFGTHTITFTATDQCGNESSCSYDFSVGDVKKPTPVCLTGLSTVVMPTTGSVTIWANDFESGSSFDDCTPYDQLRFSFSEDVNDTGFTISCADIEDGQSQTFQVEIWVTDLAGNQDFCMSSLLVVDNDDVCPDMVSNIITFAGDVFTEMNEPVANVNIYLSSSQLNTGNTIYTTDETGVYAFTNMPLGYDYQVAPYKDIDYLNGVTTLDLVGIQKHLLGIEYLSTPYKMIAADANNSSTISAIDIVEIRKLILGITTDFPNNYSWRFVTSETEFINHLQPWPFQESFQYNNVTQSFLNGDFVAVKIGDVNNSAAVNLTDLEDRGSLNTSMFNIKDQMIEAGKKYTIDFEASDFEDIVGFQYTLSLEGAVFNNAQANAIDFNESNYALISENVMTASWNDVKASKKENGEVLFSINITASSSGLLSNMMRMHSDITSAEAYTTSNEQNAIDIKFNGIKDAEAVASFELYQNEPNPFVSYTNIGFNLAEEGMVELTVYDVSGKIILSKSNDFDKGYNEFFLQEHEIDAAGIFYYEVKSNDFSAVKKMIKAID